MAITYVNGDISTSDNVDTVAGLSFSGLGVAAGDWCLGVWALILDPTPALDARFTEIDNDVDQNLRAILFELGPMAGTETGAVSLTTTGTNAINRMAAAIAIWRGVGSVGTLVNYTEGGTAVAAHPAAGNMTITPTADNALIALVYAERSSTGNTAGSMTPPTHVGTGTPATIRAQRGTGATGGTYVCIAEFQLGAGTAGVAQTFTQWTASPGTIIASNAEMWLRALYPPTSESHSGALGLSGAGTFTGAGAPAMPGSLTLSGVGALAAAGTPAPSGSVALSGAGSQADAGTPTVPGATALSGTGSLTPAGQPALPGALPLSGGGTLAFAAGSDFTGALALSGSGALAAAGAPSMRGSLVLSGAGAIAAAGTPAVASALPLAGTGTFAAAGTPALAQHLDLTGAGEFAAAGIPAFLASLELTGDGLLEPAGDTGLPAGQPGHLTASASQSLTASDSHSVLTATTEPTSRLEASDGI